MIELFIKNDYLKSEVNDENMSFICKISEILNIKKKSLIKSLTSFKGLSHRHEVFLKKKNKIFINDSKATSFSSTKFALKKNKYIFWIVGGLPMKGEKFDLSDVLSFKSSESGFAFAPKLQIFTHDTTYLDSTSDSISG